LFQGTKQVLLWPPEDHDNLYVEGSSSPVTRILDPDLKKSPVTHIFDPDLERYPR
jgi:hypothetical protein